MKIELKNIHHSERLSEETNAFTANLYINGRMVGIASNRGHGGATDYRANDEIGRKLISDAEIYCKGLPPEKFQSGGKVYELDMNLEGYIDGLVDKYLHEKEIRNFQRKAEKAMDKGIVMGVPDESFMVRTFKLSIEEILRHPRGPEILKKVLIEDVIPKLTEGRMVMNTNIPVKIFREAGLKDNQFIGQVSKEAEINRPKKRPGKKM